MISRFGGALLRAFMVVILIVTPSMMLPGVSAEGASIVMLIAIFLAGLTFFEYSAVYPGLVEFRDAPPFNRIRFGSLFLTVVCLSLVMQNTMTSNVLSEQMAWIGSIVGRVIDFPYSPVRLVVLMLPSDATVEHVKLVRDTAGISYFISLLTLALFVILLRVQRWPTRAGRFNVINCMSDRKDWSSVV